MVRVVVVGIGGYGNRYLNPLLDHGASLGAELVGIADPFAAEHPRRAEIDSRGIPVHDELADALAMDPDLVCIASPIPLHAEQAIAAMQAGAHVLCEKPAAASLADCDRMQAAAEAADRFCAIGFNMPFTAAIQRLRERVLSGELGAPQQATCLTLWPRADAYYARSPWAGRYRLDDGTLVNDSIANNATAHFIFLPCFAFADGPGTARPLVDLQAECYRSREIETYDTVAFNATFVGGARWTYIASHTVRQSSGPVIHMTFEHGAVCYSQASWQIQINGPDGDEVLPLGVDALHGDKLAHCIAAVRDGTQPICTVAHARAQVAVVEAIRASCPEVPLLDAEEIGSGRERILVPTGMDEALLQTAISGALPSAQGCWDWAAAGRRVVL